MSGYEEKSVADVLLLSARGLLTGTVTRVLGDTTLLVRSLYYDHHGNSAKGTVLLSQNILGVL